MDYSSLVQQYIEDGGSITKCPEGRPEDAPKRRKSDRVAQRRAKVARLVKDGRTVSEIAAHLDERPHAIRYDLEQLGIKAARAIAEPSGIDKANALRERRAQRAVGHLRDKRRIKVAPVPLGEYGKLTDPDQEGTIFTTARAAPSATDRVLMDGRNNSKMGGDVLVGPLAGARIFSLTLEERATCPRSCQHWRGCYGNGMPFATRWAHGPDLLDRLQDEIADLCAAHERVLIRLHVLGDFWSADYVAFWRSLLEQHDGLHVFGFTAWDAHTEIGTEIERTRAVFGLRFSVRHSEQTGKWGAFTLPEGPIVSPFPARFVGDALICPEQRNAINGTEKRVHCGSCGACWQSDRPIAFFIHGKKVSK